MKRTGEVTTIIEVDTSWMDYRIEQGEGINGRKLFCEEGAIEELVQGAHFEDKDFEI